MKTLKTMKRITTAAAVFLVTGLLFVSGAAFVGQQNFKTQKAASSMKITGTSSLHDWSIDVGDFQCDMTASADASIMKIETVAYRGKARSIKSDNNTMDKKIIEALKADKFPDIRYSVRSAKNVVLKDNKFSGLITGDIFLAGKTRSETIQFNGMMISDDKLQIKGSKKLKMTDFGINPPTAMMGALKTGDEVTVTFTLVLTIQ
jgi:polyisoprenoid-binding protein YceI